METNKLVEVTTKTSRKGTVLIIHGWAQNANVMSMKSKTLTKKLNQAGYDCVFLQAPLKLPMTSTIKVDGELVTITNGGRKDARAWFLYSKEDPGDTSLALTGEFIEYVGLDTAIRVVETELIRQIQKKGNSIIAALGFSQGAVFTHILASMANQKISPFNKIDRFILVSGFPATPRPLPPSIDNKNHLYQINIPSLHIIGLKDTSVSPSLSYQLRDCFVGAKTIEHEKGHLLVQQSAQCAEMIRFLDDAVK